MSGYEEIREKLMTAGEAVGRHIKDGSQVAIGGFTVNRNPMAVGYEIVRQGIRDLHVVCHSHGQALDVLIGAGCVKRVELAYAANGRFASTCVRFKKAVEAGEIEVEDYSNNQMSLRFLAGALEIPFIPSRTGLGTDIVGKEGFSADTRGEMKGGGKEAGRHGATPSTATAVRSSFCRRSSLTSPSSMHSTWATTERSG